MNDGQSFVSSIAYDTLDRLLQTSGTGITDTGSNSLDLAGNLSSKAGLLLGYQSGSNCLCAIGASTCGAGAGTGNMAFDANGNIQSYTRPTQAQSNNAPGADGAFLQLSGYTAFNLTTSITKSLGGTIQASAEFGYDAGYQRTRQIKRSGPTQTGAFVDDILYVVPGGFEVHRNATGQIIKSIAILSGSDGVVATVTTNFDAITGVPLAQLPTAQNGFDVSSNNSGVNTVTKLILKNHLGSMVAEITLGGTPQAPTVAVNMLSIHGFGPWGNARNAAAGLAEGQRGFTGHEQLAELGIIHMNGRFLQADPIIQAPHNAQSHNRYSYVMNNPLSMSDPSGFSWRMQWRSSVVAAATYVVVAWAIGGCLECAQFAANAVRAGMNAHANGTNALQAIASNALGAYLDKPIPGSGIEVALNGGNRRQIAGAIVGGIIGDIVGQQMGGMTGIAAGGCAGATVNRGSCWTGARDSMIAAGIQAAGTRAYEYVVSGGGTGGAQAFAGGKNADAEPLGGWKTPPGGSRWLTAGEIAMAKDVFGDTIKYDEVQIIRVKAYFFQPQNTTMAPDGNIYFHPLSTNYRDDFSKKDIAL